jgi:hypothetical protein
MTKPSNKDRITQKVCEQINDNTLSLEQAYKLWWQNPRRDGGLRLTQLGDLSFRLAGLEYHDHTVKTKDTSYYNFILDLDKKIKCPYYIDVNKSTEGSKPYLRLYDDRISMMLNLYGDLDSYLKSVKVRK